MPLCNEDVAINIRRDEKQKCPQPKRLKRFMFNIYCHIANIKECFLSILLKNFKIDLNHFNHLH